MWFGLLCYGMSHSSILILCLLELPKMHDGDALILNGFFTSTIGCGSGLGVSTWFGSMAASICKIPRRLMNQKRKLNPNRTIKAATTVKASAIFKCPNKESTEITSLESCKVHFLNFRKIHIVLLHFIFCNGYLHLAIYTLSS